MKKIFNWTFGGFFRTFGRIIAYIIIGAIVSIILSNSDFRITDLFFDNVKASTKYSMQLRLPFYKDTNLTTPYNTIEDAPTYYGIETGRVYGARQLVNFYFQPVSLENVDNVIFNYYIYNGSLVYEPHSYSVTAYLGINGQSIFCESVALDSESSYGQLSCPVSGTNVLLTSAHFYIMLQNTNDTYFRFGISPFMTLVNSTDGQIKTEIQQSTAQIVQQQEATTNAVNQQTQQQHQDANKTQETIINSTNQTISTITDNSSPDLNGTLDNNTIAGWLPPGPIDSIVTLPLTLLNSLFNAMGGTCADLVVPLPFIDSNLNIPCMSKIYNSMSFNSFFNWIGIIASAFILYKYLLRLYKWIDDTLTLRENTQVDWGGD